MEVDHVVQSEDVGLVIADVTNSVYIQFIVKVNILRRKEKNATLNGVVFYF